MESVRLNQTGAQLRPLRQAGLKRTVVTLLQTGAVGPRLKRQWVLSEGRGLVL